MHQHEAKIKWTLEEDDFVGNNYSRGHTWIFDGGLEIPASSSPLVVPLPLSVEAAVDPEEALVAAAASCHMLWFLALASHQKWVVISYEDRATGIMKKDEAGRMSIGRIELRPNIQFSEKTPSSAEIIAVHDQAHEKCFVANSLKSEIVILSN